ncbi:MAG: transferase [Deltaproteobacteria bacterium]|nr:transferase [Deltaproteobacteria bacterium]
MEAIKQLNDRIVSRVNLNLAEFDFHTDKFVHESMDYDKMLKFYAFYGITSHHPIYFHFRHSNIAGSYFLGRCYVGNSAVYKSDIRGDELKRKGDILQYAKDIPLVADEMITIRDSLLYKTLIHSNSHNPETPEEFLIRNTISTHYSNIHGTTLEGCFLGAFATVDLMNLHSCIVGEFSYVQAGELFHRIIQPGTIWVKSKSYNFKYIFEKRIIDKYIGLNTSYQPRGIISDFVTDREKDFEGLFRVIDMTPVKAPPSSAVNRYSVVIGDTTIGENVLIAQRSFLENAEMGKGSNAQENSYIINSRLVGNNVTAHGGKIINSEIGHETMVGFNAFLNGRNDVKIKIGADCIVMPHTIIDSDEQIEIPNNHLVWGYIGRQEDIKDHSISFDQFEETREDLKIGNMTFNGKASVFINDYKKRIQKILLMNGAFFKDGENRGHAQDDHVISFNTIQPYRTGQNKGIYPSIRINP